MKKIVLFIISILLLGSSFAAADVQVSDNLFTYVNESQNVTTLIYAASFHNDGDSTISDTGSDLFIYDENEEVIIQVKTDFFGVAKIEPMHVASGEDGYLFFKYVLPTKMLEGRTPTSVEYTGMKTELPVEGETYLSNTVSCDFKNASNKGYSAKVKVTNDTDHAVSNFSVILRVQDENGDTVYIASGTFFENLDVGKSKTVELFLDKNDINALKKSEHKPKNVIGVVYD